MLENQPQDTPPGAADSARARVQADLVIEAPWLLPLTDDDHERMLEDAAIAVAGGTIVASGSREAVNAGFEPKQRVCLPDHVLMPGLINAHGHAAMTLLRGSSEDAPLQRWLTEQIWPLESRWVDDDFVRDGAQLAIAEMIRSGITCFADMYFFPEITASEARAAGVRAQIAFPVIEFANAWCATSEEGFHKGLALHDQYRNDPHIDIAFGPHAVYTVTSEDLEKILMYSEELDANIQIHLHENADELTENKDRFGVSGIAHLHRHELLSPRLQAVHMTQLTPEEIALLAENNVQVVHCPTSNAKLASGISPVTALLEAGVNVALGTDGAASNNTLDMLGEARLASLLAKLEQGNAAALPAATALGMATRRGAAALGRSEQTGMLAAGLAADIIAVDMSAIRHKPLYDPAAQLLHTTSGPSVSHVWVDGQCLLEDYQMTRTDEARIRHIAESWQQRIRPR